MQPCVVALLLALLPGSAVPHRILAFLPFNGPTHHIIYRPVLWALADAGHRVTYLTPIAPPQPHPGVEVLLIRDCYPGFNSRFFVDNHRRPFSFLQVAAVYGVTTDALRTVFAQPAVEALLRSSRSFDAVLTETCFFQEATAALHHRFGAVGVELCCLGERSWLNYYAGLPDNPAYMIDYRSPYTDKMNLFERIHNAFITISVELTSRYYMSQMEDIARNHLSYDGSESRPPLSDILANLSMILVNSHPALSYPYPTAPHVKKIAGVVTYNKHAPLSEDLRNFMDGATDGVIFLSLGTNLDIVAETFGDMAGILMTAFKKVPQRVLIKWANDYHKEIPPNVRMSKWFPQQQILSHNKTVLFVTHGGYSSMYEAAYYGVPTIGIPYFGDQPKNIAAAVGGGSCLRLSNDNITVESLGWAMKEVLGNKRYGQAAEKKARMLRDVRTTPVEDALYWIEHAIKFPNALTPQSTKLSYIELNMIDAKLIALLVCILLYYSIRMILPRKVVIDVKIKTS